jgi:RHS repeat-associated protein
LTTNAKFTSKERDAETALDYFGARYMSSAQGRFTSVDPAFESEILEYPQTWNRYSVSVWRTHLEDGDGIPSAIALLP